jgi:hypothetical protein
MGDLIITWLARHVVQVYGRIIADHARRSYRPGSADAASPLDSAQLSWGGKVIQGRTKTAFFSQLIGLKLRQIEQLLGEVRRDKARELSGEIRQSLGLLQSAISDRISVATGMLSTLE